MRFSEISLPIKYGGSKFEKDFLFFLCFSSGDKLIHGIIPNKDTWADIYAKCPEQNKKRCEHLEQGCQTYGPASEQGFSGPQDDFTKYKNELQFFLLKKLMF